MIQTAQAAWDIIRYSPSLKRRGRIVIDRVAAMVATRPEFAQRLNDSFERFKMDFIAFVETVRNPKGLE